MDNFGRTSVATIREPEFLNIHSISPLISKCEIKVMYVGESRNKTSFTKEVITKMAETLPGTPIVGQYLEKEEDFGDHGDQIVIERGEVKYKCLTKPYGFVAPDTKIWFQWFEDTDEFGNVQLREYLMTEGYLWTEQFPECKKVYDKQEGNPESMELEKNSLKGFWSKDYNRGVEFFIVNDAIFSKLCVLGDAVEPCYEGSTVSQPNVSLNFQKDDNVGHTLFDMMEQLKFTLKGGSTMEMNSNESTVVAENAVVEQVNSVEAIPAVESNVTLEPVSADTVASIENSEKISDNSVEEVIVENQNNMNEYKKNDDEEKEDDSKDNKESEDNSSKEGDKKEEKDDEDKKKYQLLSEKYQNLETEYNDLKAQYEQLNQFRLKVEEKEKDELISSFYMLSDEDKKDVIDNKSKYTLDDIKAKLSIICVDKRVSFELHKDETDIESEVSKSNIPVTYSLNPVGVPSELPSWLRAVEETKKNMN